MSTNLPATDTPATSGAPKKRIPRRIAEVCHLLLTGECKTVKAAAKRIGMNPNYVYTALKKPEIRVFIARRARENLAAGTMRASARLLDMLDAKSERVVFEASRHVLAIDGIKPAAEAQVSVNIELRAGYVIDLREPEEIEAGRPLTIEHAAGP
jgi:hypothetical protein